MKTASVSRRKVVAVGAGACGCDVRICAGFKWSDR